MAPENSETSSNISSSDLKYRYFLAYIRHQHILVKNIDISNITRSQTIGVLSATGFYKSYRVRL